MRMSKKNLLFFYIIFSYSSSFIYQPMVLAQEGFGQTLGQRKSLIDTLRRDIESFGTSDQESLAPHSSDRSSFGLPLSAGMQAPDFYNIHVLGEVVQPGTYRIIPSDRVSDAIKYAGGTTLHGSQRAIQLRRQGNTQILDFFSYKYKGNLNSNPYLMENDVIFVPVKRGEIQVVGPVNRPGNYEISKKITLKETIGMAGGFATGLSLQEPIRVIRYNSDEKKEVVEVRNSPDEIAHLMIQKGDVVVIPHILIADKEFDYNLKRIPGDNIFYPTIDDNVYVVGAVLSPGAHEFKPHYTYKEYVNLAGPLKYAKMRSIRVLRPDGKKIHAKRTTNIHVGDTIIVPQRYWKPETVASWLGTLSSLTLSTILITDRFK